MGVPRLFRYLSDRYPCLVDDLTANQVLDFDNFYLDMNGIIHQCCNYSDLSIELNEENVYKNIFYYVEILYNYVKPKKLLFIAVDGVAPRAKLNNQRCRRFSKAKEREIERKKLIAEGRPVNANSFDSNSISPGTLFMECLDSQLQYFVTSKLSTDPLWQGVKVILSGHQTPGEGEHKIMEYLRYLRTQPDYDPNLRHCIFGADADLMMLVLSTHEPHFFIIREKAENSKSKRLKTIDAIEYQLINVPFLRDYLDLEFGDLKEKLTFFYDLDHIVDDWILMTFLLGNDFLPKLPDFDIKSSAIPVLYKTYKEVLPELDGYLNENGRLHLPRFQEFMEKLANYDLENFKEIYADLNYLESKMCQTNTYEEEESKISRKVDLEALIKATNDMFEPLDEEENECNDENNDTFLLEFYQRKKNYYWEKMGLEMTDDVLKNQAEEYIRGVQWNLYYYFHGCKSWDWFYPHHYSPYISDIVNFKDLSFEFDLSEPLNPFEQLMAILPPSSKDNVPKIYHNLMTSPDSPIIDFYPETFETDLREKDFPWEAIILLPFVDKKRLKDAMAPFQNQLTEEEKRRNQFSPMHVYTYSEKDLGTYPSSGYFPDITVNHAHRIGIFKSEIFVESSALKFIKISELPNAKFSTLKLFPYKGSLKVIKDRPSSYWNKEESFVLTLDERETPDLRNLAETLLGEIVHVNWPNLMEAKVTAVASSTAKLNLNPDGSIQEEDLSKDYSRFWSSIEESMSEFYLKKRGIIIGETKLFVYAKQLEGQKYTFDNSKVDFQKIWASNSTAWPYQIVVLNYSGVTDFRPFKNVNDAFPVGSTVFMLNKINFGAKGKVVDNTKCTQKGCLNVVFEIFNDIRTDQFLSNNVKTDYVPCKIAATTTGISCRLFGKITGCIIVIDRAANDDSIEKESNIKKVNIGLKMKWPGKNEELPGYTKKENNFWYYSRKTMQIVSEYLKAFPKVFEYVAENLESPFYYVDEIFPEGPEEMEKMVKWTECQPYKNVEFITSGSEVLDPLAVSELEKRVSNFKKEITLKTIQTKVEDLYKSDLYLGKVYPMKATRHCLYDRIVSIRASYMVPTGLRGFIIGINGSSSDEDTTYDILFDEPFAGAYKLYTKDNRVYKLPGNYFLNLTSSNRTLAENTAVNPNDPVKNKVLSSGITISEPSSSSAFAQWNQPKPQNQFSKPVQILTRNPRQSTPNEDFQKMWTNMLNGKPQEETMILKQILKIGGTNDKPPRTTQIREQQDVIDSVKTFFQNIQVPPTEMHNPPLSGAMIPSNISVMAPLPFPSPRIPQMFVPPPGPYLPPTMPPRSYPPPTSQPVMPMTGFPPTHPGYFSQLCLFYGRRNMPFPKYNSFRVSNKVAIQLICADGKIFPSLAMDDERSALESAARNALLSLGIISDQSCQKDKTMENQTKLFAAIQKPDRVVNMKSVSLRPDAPNNSLKPPLQLHGKDSNNTNNCNNQIPQTLPLPPQQWMIGPDSGPANLQEQCKGKKQKYESSTKEKPKSLPEGDKKAKVESQKPSDSALGFVPLQAITGKRNFKPIATTQTAKSPQADSNTSKIIREVQTPKTIANQTKKEITTDTAKPKIGRPRHRIAANLNLDPNLY